MRWPGIRGSRISSRWVDLPVVCSRCTGLPNLLSRALQQCLKHPDAHRLDMKFFIYKPIARLRRYETSLRGIVRETPAGHADLETIPAVLNVIKGLERETEPGVVSAKQKVELWGYNANLVFRPGEYVVCLFLNLPENNAGRSLMPDRTWTCSTKTDY